MQTIKISILTVFTVIFLAILPVFSSSTNLTIPISGVVRYNTFQIRGADVHWNAFHPSARNYIPNAWNIVEDLNLNLLRIFGGVEGDVYGLYPPRNPDTWAQVLDDFLTQADAHGCKVVFFEMGGGWQTLFGLEPNITPLSECFDFIDQLAGDNNLGHNFLTDPRILGWSVANEVDLTDPSMYNWCIQVADYIRSKGGKAWLASPRGAGGWFYGEDFHVTEPILRGHADYLERHYYAHQLVKDNPSDPYSAVYSFYRQVLQTHMIDGRGSFSMDQLILGEFGIWRGTATGEGVTNTYSDWERREYYRAVFDAARDVGIKNIIFHDLFAQINPKTNSYLSPMYSVVDTDGTYFPLVADVIKEAYHTS